MHFRICFFSVLGVFSAIAQPPRETPQQSLNGYVAFLNQATEVVTSRFKEVQQYNEAVRRFRANGRSALSLPSSGPLETYYYQKALAGNRGLTAAETKQLATAAQSIWQTLEKLDQTAKALETYVRLNDYQRDALRKSDELLNDMQALTKQFSQEQEQAYQQISQIYRRYQPYSPANPYLSLEKEMHDILVSERKVLQAWPYYMDEGYASAWPVERVKEQIVANETILGSFGKASDQIRYPASSMVPAFKESIRSIQEAKRQAVNAYTFSARQSARHGNDVYLSLINYYNNDLLATYQNFVNYSATEKQLLAFPKFCPVFELNAPRESAPKTTVTEPFRDVPLITFTTAPTTSPITQATFQALNAHIDFINESLRQLAKLQYRVRDYQATADYYRDPARSQRRNPLTYTHTEFEIPTADYELLLKVSQSIPPAYRHSVNTQAEVLMNILKEMDALSIELVNYTQTGIYQQDKLQRSDQILDRYALLFDLFDQRKEQLYRDIRRIHESYKVAEPANSWYVAGKAMLNALDEDKAILFGIKAYYKGDRSSLPGTDINDIARKLIADEYQNLKGLTRYGRSNGLCPYSPYEDLAQNSIRLGEKAQRLKASTTYGAHPYEEFYYFYNGELVYQYNKFSELAKAPVLKAIIQPNLFAFQRSGNVQPANNPNPPAVTTSTAPRPIPPPAKTERQRDTVYIERTKTDTVYVDRTARQEDLYTLKGFAANNMVLLLDVSASMDSPYKMPLLKKSIKSLLTLLRPEDQLSIVVYSGKAKVALKTTSGAEAAQIARLIDRLESNGDTDGDEGIRLAYKVANKSYIRGGNNRIVLATDGEFPISEAVYRLVAENARQDVSMTVFTFGRNAINSASLKKLAALGKGSCDHVTQQNADLRLILEVRAKKIP